MLGYALLVSPSSVEAAELGNENQAVESAETETISDEDDEDNLVEENKENKKEDLSEGNKEETPAPAEETEKPKEETPATTEAPKETEKKEEASEDKEVFTLTEGQRQALKEADFTDSEIAEIEKEIANKLEADSSLNPQTLVDEKISEKTATLEMDEEVKPEAVAAADENREPKDISNDVTNINGSIEGLTNEDATTIKPIAQDTNLEGKDYDTQAEAILSFYVPDSTIEGDHVDITLSNNVNINGIVENVQPGQLDAFFGPEKIATASYDKANRTIRYTFTKAVESYGHVKVNTRFPLFIDKNVVTAPKSEQTIGVKVGDKAPIERTYTVDYHMDNIGGNDKYVSNGYSDITNVNREEGTYDHTIYINPLGKVQKGTKLTIENLPGNSGVIFDQDVLDNVKLYVVKDPGNLALSFAWDPDNLVEVRADGYSKKLDGDKIVLNIKNKVDPVNPNKPAVIREDSVLVARYEGKFKNDAFDDAATRVTFDNGTPARTDNYHWDNIIYTTDADASSKGDEEMGYFEDYHVYQTINADGSITTDDFDFVDQQQGPESKEYTTVRKDRVGYELVSVESPDGAAFDEHGAKTTGNFVNGKTLHVKYVYQKRPVEKKGSFQEHHIYITKDKDGKEIKREVVDGKVSGGTKDMTYTTGKDEKDGFKFVRTENPVENPTFDEKGEATKGNYKPGVKQEITYVYEKTESEWTPIEPSEPVDPEKPGETSDIPWIPLEPSEPVDPEKPGEGDSSIPWTPLEPSEPVEPETPGEAPDIPWTPLEPSEPVEPETPETPEKPENPEKPEKPGKENPTSPEVEEPGKPGKEDPKDPEVETPEAPEKPENPEKPEKPEKTGKENPTNPEGDKDKKDNRVKVPVVKSKKEVKKETPVRKNGNPKTGVGSISGAALGLIAAASGLFVSKKNKDEE